MSVSLSPPGSRQRPKRQSPSSQTGGQIKGTHCPRPALPASPRAPRESPGTRWACPQHPGRTDTVTSWCMGCRSASSPAERSTPLTWDQRQEARGGQAGGRDEGPSSYRSLSGRKTLSRSRPETVSVFSQAHTLNSGTENLYWWPKVRRKGGGLAFGQPREGSSQASLREPGTRVKQKNVTSFPLGRTKSHFGFLQSTNSMNN